MIKYYDYSSIITKQDELKCLDVIDDLFKTGNWDKEVPYYQTFANLHEYSEFNIFTQTFLQSCSDYSKIISIIIKILILYGIITYQNFYQEFIT